MHDDFQIFRTQYLKSGYAHKFYANLKLHPLNKLVKQK